MYPTGTAACKPGLVTAVTERDPGDKRAYRMQGTPTTILIDPRGRLRRHVFGVHDDLLLGAEIATLLAEIKDAGPGPRSG